MTLRLPLRSCSRVGGRSFSAPGLNLQLGSRHFAREASRRPVAVAATNFQGTASTRSLSWAAPLALLAGTGLSALYAQPLHLDSTFPKDNVGTSAPFSSASSDSGIPQQADMPKSDVNVYNLGFGTVCGICSGIFIKKGAKFLAFLLGGGFVLLQVSPLPARLAQVVASWLMSPPPPFLKKKK